jgi:hypothetical protein
MNQNNIVFTSLNIMEANLVKSLLESNNIQVFVIDENISRINPFYTSAVGGIKLVVPDNQIQMAQEVLDEYRKKEGQDPNYGSSSW